MIVSDIALEYGADGLVEIVILDNLTNLPLNLNSYTMAFVINDSALPLFTEQSSSNVSLGTDGTLSILFDSITTTHLHRTYSGNNSYRVYITSQDGITLLASKGFLTIE